MWLNRTVSAYADDAYAFEDIVTNPPSVRIVKLRITHLRALQWILPSNSQRLARQHTTLPLTQCNAEITFSSFRLILSVLANDLSKTLAKLVRAVAASQRAMKRKHDTVVDDRRAAKTADAHRLPTNEQSPQNLQQQDLATE